MARGLIAILGMAIIAAATLGAGAGLDPAAAQEASSTKPKAKSKGLKGSIGYRRAYSYSKADVTGPDNIRLFADPGYTRQTPSGPFDNGFFFDSGIGLHGGQAPYQQ